MPDTLPAGRGALRLADAIEALTEGFALFDEAGALVLCNRRFRELNPTMAELITPGATWDILVHEAEVRGLVDAGTARRLRWMEACLEPGGPPDVLEIEAPSGAISAVALSATDSGGFVLTQRDVTARRRLDAAEREADLLLRKVLEACPVTLVMSRVGDGHVIYRSPAATELLGTAATTFDHFASREQRADFVTALLPNGRVDEMGVTCLRPDGAPFPASISARLIDYRDEEVVVSSIVDLTRELAMQAELAAQRETIFQNEKMSALGELLAGVAHELNNPLSVVVGHALMLQEEVRDPGVLRRLDKIGKAAERCSKIVKTFLAMARQEPVELAPVDLGAAVRTGVDAIRNGPSGVGARLEAELADGLPRVMADADQIAQLVVNLVANAGQAIATSGRGDTIRVISRHDPAADEVELRVEDNGPGIPEAIRGRVFEPFFTTKAVGEGTGLGLALCHRVVTSHRGRIGVEPRRGGGTAFVIRLPVAKGPAVAASAPPEAERARRARILVVEDEADVAELIREVLLRQGYDVDHASSGEAALERLREQAYALILSDIAMPGLDGRGLFEAIRRDWPAMVHRTGFVSGDTMGPAARAFLATTDRPRLEKPVAPGELRVLVARMLAEAEATP